MTYTITVQGTRSPDLTPQQFLTHNEEVHIPLLRSLVGDSFPLSHTRHYVKRSPNPPHAAMVFVGAQEDVPYDMTGTLVFNDEEHFQRYMTRLQEPDAAAKMAEDAERYMKKGSLRIWAVEEGTVTKE